jgi:hypothetical protein
MTTFGGNGALEMHGNLHLVKGLPVSMRLNLDQWCQYED